MRFPAAALAVLILTASCSGPDSSGSRPADSPDGGKLVVGDDDSAIFLVRPDGSERTDLVTESSGRVVIQPTWSPDGAQVIWTEIDHMADPAQPSIAVAEAAGPQPARHPVAAAPFYYYWSPVGDRVAFLANDGRGGIDLGLFDIDSSEAKTLENGRPYYFAWAPDGQSLLTHVGAAAVSILVPDGPSQDLATTGAQFAAPQWSLDGRHLVYAIGEPPPTGGTPAVLAQTEDQQIVLTGPDGAIVRRIESFRGSATFDLGPDGERLAYSITPERRTYNFGPLKVMDLTDGSVATVSSDPVLAYQWSPAGDHLLVLQAIAAADHPAFRWLVWDGSGSRLYATFTPTTSFANSYLPFWDQYSHSHRLWAPDGSAFAYAAIDENGRPSVWVQPLDADEPERVASGDIVFWSPR